MCINEQLDKFVLMIYPVCYQLGDVFIMLIFNHLLSLFNSCQSVPTYPQSTNLFCFFFVGNTNALWANWVGFSGSFFGFER